MGVPPPPLPPVPASLPLSCDGLVSSTRGAGPVSGQKAAMMATTQAQDKSTLPVRVRAILGMHSLMHM